MRVHNFYSDVLLSLSYFVNNITDSSINTFQYNIGSRSFNLDYNPNYNLPAAYITYNNTTHVNARPSGFLKTFNNYNQIPVLYDIQKELSLKIQEDLFTLDLDLNLNTDSQLHIINLKHNIETRIPLNKYLQFYKFTSFFELNDDYLNPYLFDPSNDDIENLYFKHDRILDRLNYCFSVTYEPLLKLTSINFNDLDVNAGTYGLQLSFEMMIQLPIRLLFNYSMPSQKEASYSDNKKIYHNDVSIPVLSAFELDNGGFIEFLLKHNNKNYTINAKCKQDTENNNLYTGSYNNSDLSFNFEFNVINYKVTGIVDGLINNVYIDKGEVILYVGAENIIYGNVYSDHLSGLLKDVKFEDNSISAYFSGEFDSSIQEFRIEELNFQETFKQINITPPVIDNKDIYVISTRSVTANNIYSKIRTISIPRTEINFDLTKINKVVFFDNTNDSFIEYDIVNSKIDKYGDFKLDIDGVGIIEGSINKQSGNLELSNTTILDSINDYIIYEINFDFVFDFYFKRGPGNIEQLSIDFNLINEHISGISPLDIPQFDSNDFTLVLDSVDFIKTDNNRYEFFIKLPHYNKEQIKSYSFYITFNKYITSDNEVEVIMDKTNSTNEICFFSMTESIYHKYFSKISKIYPMFFSTKLIK